MGTFGQDAQVKVRHDCIPRVLDIRLIPHQNKLMDTKELNATFEHFDRDKNGAIDFVEFKELLTALDAKMDDDSSRLGFGTIDINGSGTIQFEEFRIWWEERP